jgi:hypothetical protein
MKVSGQRHAPVALLRGMSSQYLLDRRWGCPQSRSRRYEVRKNVFTTNRALALHPVTDWAMRAATYCSGLCINYVFNRKQFMAIYEQVCSVVTQSSQIAGGPRQRGDSWFSITLDSWP